MAIIKQTKHERKNKQKVNSDFLKTFKTLYQEDRKKVPNSLFVKRTKRRRESKVFIQSLIRKIREKPVEYTQRAMTYLDKVKKQSTPDIQYFATQALRSILYNPMVLSKSEEYRGLRAVKRCAKSAETDNFNKKFKMKRHLNRLTYSNSAAIRNAAVSVLQTFNLRHEAHCEQDLENANMDIQRLQVAIKNQHPESLTMFRELMNYVDSLSPTIRLSAETAVEECLHT
ncbi:MAG: hypothetical protein VW378_04945 [bacterium]